MAEPLLEIERTFLLNGMPEFPAHVTSVRMQQGYLPDIAAGQGGTSMHGRLRRKVRADGSVACTRTIKCGLGLVRKETQHEITEAEFEANWASTADRRLLKTRHSVTEGDLTWEIDEYDELDLVLAEVELISLDQASPIPAWLAAFVVREVTDEPAYRNYEIALRAVRRTRQHDAEKK